MMPRGRGALSIGAIVTSELGHRKLNAALILAAIGVAAASVSAVLTVLRVHDLHTVGLLDARRQEVEERGKALQDDMRKITKGLGFNILILPADQQLSDIYADGYAVQTMPEDYVTRLSEVPSIQTIAHLLPALERKVEWPEQKRTILLVGIRGEVPFVEGKQKKPLLDPVEDGKAVLGYELHRQLGLEVGDSITLLGRDYSVSTTYEQRGSKDDITVWIPLRDAQELLGETDRINAIWALNCNCYSVDRLAEVRQEVIQALPDTQVIELAGKATARAEARKRAHEDAIAALAAEESSRQAIRGQLETMGAVLAPLSLLACGAFVGLLSFSNARDRHQEIGILRAIGVPGGRIAAIFLGKSSLLGLTGGLAGAALGILGAWLVSRGDGDSAVAFGVLWSRDVTLSAIAIVVGAPILAALATWLPAQYAAQLDPASVLRKEG